MSRLLNFQADRIELVLASHKVPARVTGGRVTPRLIRFHLSTPLGVRVRHLANLSEEIALSLDAPSCRVSRQQGRLHVDIPRPDAHPVRLLHLCHRLRHTAPIPPLSALLGLDSEGIPLLLRLPSPNVAHILIAGTTGSGKTVLARSIIASLALLNSQRSLQFALIDPKAHGFLPFLDLPHLLCPIISNPDDALPLLLRLIDEMQRRDAQHRSEPRIILAIDELTDLLLTGGSPVERALTRLSQRGRQAGIHLIACSQKPTAAVIGSLVKSNFPTRLVGSVPCPEDAKVATGLPASGAERLLGQGDFLLVSKGSLRRFQAAYIDDPDISLLVSSLGHRAPHPLLPLPATCPGRRPSRLLANLFPSRR